MEQPHYIVLNFMFHLAWRAAFAPHLFVARYVRRGPIERKLPTRDEGVLKVPLERFFEPVLPGLHHRLRQ